MNGTIVALALAFVLACSSTPALSADASVSASRSNRLNVEVKPLLFLANLAPGSHGAAAGLELPLGDHVAAFANASYLSLKSTAKTPTSTSAEESTGSDAKPTVKEARLGGATGGLRYYGHVASDSWYAGLGGGVGNSQVTWMRDAETLADKSSTYSGEIEAGYRWLWTSGFLMRVGAQLTANNQRDRTISTASTTAAASPEAVAAVTKESGGERKNSLNTGFDFGVGWAF